MAPLPPSIGRRMREEGGRVTFARFMELALTDPESGYYASADRFLGETGDFTTAPRKAPAFNRAVARVLADLVDQIPDERVVVVEVGGGEGDLAAGILGHWMRTRLDLRERISYRVADVGERLLERQVASLDPARAAGWDVGPWSDVDRQGVAPVGLIVTNELLDAFPVHLVDVREVVPREAWVSFGGAPADDAVLTEEWGDLSAPAAEELQLIAPGRRGESLRVVSADGFVELRPAVRSFLREWSARFDESALLTIDYGEWLAGPGDEAPPSAPGADAGSARMGTDLHRRSLRGYIRHRRTRDPYGHVGRQDLTADVDFRALALHGADLGYECIFYATLASFLRAAGVEGDLPGVGEGEEEAYSLEADIRSAPLASLLAEDGVGGLFKVMLQVRDRGGE